MKRIVLATFMFLLVLSCSENNTTGPVLDPFTKSLLVPAGTEIDGGLFLISAGKNNDSIDPTSIKTRVVLHYKSWPGVVSIFLDDSSINQYDQRVNINPFVGHRWNVIENQKVGIPGIQKTVPPLQSLTISNVHNYDSIVKGKTIYWNPPQNDTSTKIFILLQKFGIDTVTTDSIWVVPSHDNGAFTFSADYYNSYKPGDKIKIDIFRVKSEVETYENRKYLFATLFDTHLIVYVK